MKRAILFGTMAAGLMLVCGCSKSDAEGLTKETISVMNEMAGVMENAKTAKDAKPQMEKLSARLQEIKKKMDTIKPSKAEEENLKKKYEPELKKLMERFMKASLDLAMKDPAGAKDLGEVMKKIGN